MKFIKPVLAFIRRRIISLIFLGFYIRSWVFCFMFFHSLPTSSALRCGMPDFGMFISIMFLSCIYLITFLVLTLVNKGQSQNEFIVITAIILLPIYIGIIDMLT